MKYMNYNECVNYLFHIPKFSKDNKRLEKISEILKRLGNPQDQFKVIHVAGTNGKGSVCAMLSSIYQQKYKVGLFTSPHLIHINERIKINGKDITDNKFQQIFLKVYQEVKAFIEEGKEHLNFFEMLFVMAMVYFADQKVDLVVLETGLGGRLDATNCIKNPLITIITKLSLDHKHILGDTIEEIAIEKAGIIKKNVPTIFLGHSEKIDDLIKNICKDKNSKFYKTQPINCQILKTNDKTIDFSLQTPYYSYKNLRIHTIAEYQIYNLAIVLLAMHILQNIFPIEEQLLYQGIDQFHWPGRMELIQNCYLLDGAHNEDGVQLFIDTINRFFHNKDIYLAFMAMKDKDYKAMVKRLVQCEKIKKIILPKLAYERFVDCEVLKKEFERYSKQNVVIEKNFLKQVKMLKCEDTLYCFIGSLYFIGEVKNILEGGTIND